jgi:hypothetical protein
LNYSIVPPQVKSSYEQARAKAKNPYGDVHPWPENCVPLQDFDSLFFHAGDDTGPEDECWLDHRDSTAMHAFADQLFAQARIAQARLDWNDPLLKHEIRAIKNGAHPYHYLDECTWRKECARARPNAPLHTKAFYEKLRRLISEPEVTSVAYRGRGDYTIYRILCTKQRQRADKTGQEPGRALVINTVSGGNVNSEAWGAVMWFYTEGLGYGDIYIEEACYGASVKELVEAHRHESVSGRYILSVRDEGKIKGFVREAGDGWVLYSRQGPYDRRRSIDASAWYLVPAVKRILEVQEGEAPHGIYSHEHIVLLVGTSGEGQQGRGLARRVSQLADRCEHLSIIVEGDAAFLEEAGCRKVINLPSPGHTAEDAGSGEVPQMTKRAMRECALKADVIILLDTSERIESAFTEALQREALQRRSYGPEPYIVAAGQVGESLGRRAAATVLGSLLPSE